MGRSHLGLNSVQPLRISIARILPSAYYNNVSVEHPHSPFIPRVPPLLCSERQQANKISRKEAGTSMPKRILVTGGAGYIGSVVVAQLLHRGHEVIVLDDLSNGHRGAVPVSATFIQGDIADRALLDRIFSETKPEAVIHLAAFIEAGESMKHPEKFFRNNTASTLTLLETVLAHGVRRFVFSSTAALYRTAGKRTTA